MKSKLITVIILSFLYNGYSQQTDNSVNKHLLKGNLLFFPSLVYELGVTKSSAFKAEIGTSLTLFERFNETKIGVFPKLETQYKFYYNLNKRADKNRLINGNSANFIALVGIYQGEEDLIGDSERVSKFLFLGPAWGLQRTYKSGFSFLVELGFGYDFGYKEGNDNNGRPFPIIGLELGWILFKTKKFNNE